MQMIAREMAVPETAFILPADRPGRAAPHPLVHADGGSSPLRARHVASFHALAEEGKFGMEDPGSYAFNLETKSGVLPVNVEKTRDAIDVLFGLTLPEFVRAGQYKLDVMRILNITLEEFENRMPIVVANYLYVPIRRLHTIFSMKPNFFAMSQFLSNRNLSGLCAFTTETVDKGSHVHSRFFAPTVGINEDPVTGSANGPLGAYLFERGEVEPVGDTVTIIGEQGDVIGRKGRVTIKLAVQGTQVTSVQIGGRAVTVMEGEMLVD